MRAETRRRRGRASIDELINCFHFPEGGVEPEGAAFGSVEGGVAFAGSFNFWPTTILSVVKLFADRSALTVTPNSVAILVKLSPDFTV